MNPDNAKIKAEELVSAFGIAQFLVKGLVYNKQLAKASALIAVEEILNSEPSEPSNQTKESDWENVITYRKAYSEAAEFWILVKEAIQEM